MDKSLFDEACARHRAYLLNLAMRLTRRDQEASLDILQDCLLHAWLAWGNVVVPPDHDLNSAQRAWLSRILVNVFVSKYRRQRRHDRALSDRLDEVVSGTCPSAETGPSRATSYSGAESAAPTARAYVQPAPATLDLSGDEVRAAVNSLPDNQRAVVERFYFDDQSMPEIAKALGISLTSTWKLAYRARIALSRSLGRYARENYGLLVGVDTTTLEPAASPEPDADGVDAIVRRDDGRELRVG